jgi:hypothetical protein
VDVDAGAFLEARGGENRDMDGSVDGFQQLPKRGGGVVAQDRSVTAGEDGRHPACVPTWSAVAYRVDAAVEAMQLPSTHLSRDRFRSDAGRFELSSRHGSMLPRRDCGDPLMCRVAFCIHTDA